MAESVANLESNPRQAGGYVADVLRWVGLIGIVTIAVMRCVIVFAPQVHFDVDPVSDPTPLGGSGPAESLVLDVILLVSCAIALIGEWRSGRSVDWKLLALALIPIPVVIWHGSADAGDLWRGSTWAAAAIACAIASHLARDRVMRIILIALLAAVVAPILVRGFNQVFVEHPAMVKLFEERKEQIFRDRGWEMDSSAARIYERRLRQPQPLGWFATTNIVASFVSFGLVFWIGMTITATRAKLQSGWAGAMALCALACAIALHYADSLGAIGATFIGLAFAIALAMSRTRMRDSNRFPAVIACTLILLTLLGVIIRGALVPEGFAGDKSLLFRWHYMIASARILVEDTLLGVGPDGFQAAYTMHRVPRNPEEVASAHSMFIDWLCMLGIGGFAWIGLVFLALWRGGRSLWLQQTNSESVDVNLLKRIAIRAALIVAALAFIPAFGYFEIAVLDPHSALVRAIGIVLFIALGYMMVHILARDATRSIEPWLLAAVTTLVIHGQIEMTFSQPGSAVWCMTVVALLASPTKAASARLSNVAAIVSVLVIVAFATWLTIRGAIPAISQQQLMADAESRLEAVRRNPDDRALAIERRQAAAAKLIEAYEAWPIEVRPLEAAAVQLEIASQPTQGVAGGAGRLGGALGLLMQSRDVIERAVNEHRKPSSIAMAVGINVRLAQAKGDDEYWTSAISHSHELTRIDPHGISSWKRLGDVLWAANQRAEAVTAYERALQNDANFGLDEEKRLSDRPRSEIQSRIEESRKSVQGGVGATDERR